MPSLGQIENKDAAHLVQKLLPIGSNFASQIVDYSNSDLASVLARILQTDNLPNKNDHREIVATSIFRNLDARGDRMAESAAQSLLSTPIIQQADHSSILLDEETCLNNLLHYFGCIKSQQNILLVSQCSTISCLSRREPVAGPVFLRTRNQLLQIFSHSKRFLKDAHFCSLPSPLRLTFSKPSIDRLLKDFVQKEFSSAPELYRQVNAFIWKKLALEYDVHRIAFDESVTSEILAAQIERPGPISKLFFDPHVRGKFLDIKREYSTSKKNIGMNRPLPDFLWLRDGPRLYEVNWRNDAPTWHSDARPLPIKWQPNEIARLLRSGDAYASRFMAYLVRCLLPGIAAMGGSIQQDYVQDYKRILSVLDDEVSFLDQDERATIEWPGLSRLSGRPLLEPTPELKNSIQEVDLLKSVDKVFLPFLSQPVGKTVGKLSCANFYHDIVERIMARK